MTPLKQTLAAGFEWSGLNSFLLGIQSMLWRPHVRAVNYHDVPPELGPAFEAQLRFYAEHFKSVDLAGLSALRNGDWPHDRPGLIISFDDGLRSHADVVAPLLERYGMCGWFMVPVDFVDVPVAQQPGWARDHSIQVSTGAFDDERIALDWDDIQRLDTSHVVGCHTCSHQRLGEDLDDRQLELEISGSKKILEERLGHAVPAFAWVGGEERAYSSNAARVIRAAGFKFSFMTNNAVIRPSTDPMQLQRSNIEADFPMSLTRFTISGFYDLIYWPKRRRVNRLTAGNGE